MKQNQRGIASLLIIITVCVLGVVAISAASFYILKSQGKAPVIESYDGYEPTEYSYENETDESLDDYYESDEESEVQIGSQSDINSPEFEEESLEQELESLEIDSLDEDLESLDSELNSL